eukprot:3085934-Alexandrium_andersonii.AAC.1
MQPTRMQHTSAKCPRTFKLRGTCCPSVAGYLKNSGAGDRDDLLQAQRGEGQARVMPRQPSRSRTGSEPALLRKQ